jgi:hypothetical protein
MLPNLRVEQGRNGHTDEQVAEKLGLNPQEYGLRKESGEFLLSEVKALMKLYNKPFDFLFHWESGPQASTRHIFKERKP